MSNQGKYDEAGGRLKEALSIRRRLLGASHRVTLTSVSNLAMLYQDQGRYADAEPLFKEALAGYHKALGDGHPNTLHSVNNLAMLYQAQGRYAEAEQLFKEALAGNRKAFGDAHPRTLTSVSNLAWLYKDQGRYAEAESMARESLDSITNHLERTSVIQSETAQLANAESKRWHFTTFLKATAKANAAKTYALVLRWRGAVTARQTFARATRAADHAAQDAPLRSGGRLPADLGVGQPPTPAREEDRHPRPHEGTDRQTG